MQHVDELLPDIGHYIHLTEYGRAVRCQVQNRHVLDDFLVRAVLNQCPVAGILHKC